MSFRVRSSWESWPTLHADTGILHPGAALLGFYRDGELTGVVRRWVGDESQWLARWPMGDSDREPPAPSMYFSADSDARAAEVWFEAVGFDAEEYILGRAELQPQRPPVWLHELPSGPEGLVVEALAGLLVHSFSPDQAHRFPQNEVIAMPGPNIPGLPGDLAERSWHVVRGGQALRALEVSPLRDSEDDSLRARRARLVYSTSPAAAPGFALWRSGDVRLWRSGEEPLLDPPLAPRDYSPWEALLAEYLCGEVADSVPGIVEQRPNAH